MQSAFSSLQVSKPRFGRLKIARESWRYLATSVLALAIDFGCLTLLVSVARAHYLVGATAGFMAGTLVMFGLSVAWVFPDRSFTSWTTGFAAFTAIGAVGLVVSLAVMVACIERFQADYKFAKCAAAGISFLFNFFVRRAFLFMDPQRKRIVP